MITFRQESWLIRVAVVASLSACRTEGDAPPHPSPPPLPADDVTKSTPVSQWPEPAPFELWKPNPDYAKSPDQLKGQTELIGKIAREGPLAHNYSEGCAWRSYGVRRQGDEDDGLFWLAWDECGKKSVRDLSQLSVGKTYRFVLGPPSRVEGRLQILDAITVGGPPFPPCTKTPVRSLEVQGLTMADVQTRLGRPDRQDDYLAGERAGSHHGAIERAYPPNAPDNQYVRIQEWVWRVDDCILSVWLHAPTGEWRVLDDFYRHKD